MKVLAFDTSSTACSVALLNETKLTTSHQIAPMQQARLILPAIESLLQASSLTLKELDAIVYGCGPGSFTGIRIASSTAQGLSFAAQLPVMQISSLAAMAQTAFIEQQWKSLFVMVDARMGQVYWAIYTLNRDGYMELIGPEQINTPDEIVLPEHFAINSVDWYGIGDGWNKYGEELTQRLGSKPRAIHSSQLATAAALLSLAKPKFEHSDWKRASLALPVYLR